MLLLSFLPYLMLGMYDSWLHEKARRVPIVEQILHGLVGIAIAGLLWSLFRGHPALALPSLGVFTVAALADELGYHGKLDRRERRLHFIAYACFGGFIGVAVLLHAF